MPNSQNNFAGNPLLNFDKSAFDDTLFLDRDGVINVLRPNDYVKSWDEFVFKEDFLEAARELAARFKRIVIVTNQRCVGKGLVTEAGLAQIHSKMRKIISDAGGRIDAIYYCGDIDDASPNRKPHTGMFEQALRDFPEINVGRSLMIGDSESDMAFAKNCSLTGIKV